MVFNDLFEQYVAAIPALLIDAAQLVRDHSDDGVQAFAGWLISQGQELYEKSIKKPGLFARYLSEVQLKSKMENEWIAQAIRHAHHRITGKVMPTWWDREIKRCYSGLTPEEIKAAGKVKEIIETMTRNPMEADYLIASALRAASRSCLDSWISAKYKKNPGPSR